MIELLFFMPFFVQTIAIGVDEIYYHLKRGLPRWERIGHPLDTLSVVCCLVFILFMPFNSFSLKIYIGLAVFSCLMVTKDEFVHKHHCPVGEHWLHALLFINHPMMLTSAGFMWAAMANGENGPCWVIDYLRSPHILQFFLACQALLATLFMFYQIIYWNFVWRKE